MNACTLKEKGKKMEPLFTAQKGCDRLIANRLQLQAPWPVSGRSRDGISNESGSDQWAWHFLACLVP